MHAPIYLCLKLCLRLTEAVFATNRRHPVPPSSHFHRLISPLEDSEPSMLFSPFSYLSRLISFLANGNPITLIFKSGRGKKGLSSPFTFSSPADFADFAKLHLVFLVSKDGTRKRGVRTFKEATSDTEGDYLLLTTFDTLDDKVTNLEAHRKNSSNGQERATTRAIATSEHVRKEFGSLTLVCAGESILFYDTDEKPFLEADGIIANTTSVLLNSLKHSPKLEDVESLVWATKSLERILARPSGFTSDPDGALDAMKGITVVKPFLSGYDFPPNVLEACRIGGVRAMQPNGKDYGFVSRGLHTFARVGLSLLRK